MSKYKVSTYPISVRIDQDTTGSIEFTSLDSCFHCANWNVSDTCTAFPDGIPDEILSGENDHTKPLPDQKNDIVFEQK